MVAPGRDVALARCRCLYLGNTVPTHTAAGVDGLQEPLSQVYPVDTADLKGLDCWLTVHEELIVVEFGNRKELTWPISSMHLCAALRRIFTKGVTGERLQRFIAIDSPVSDDKSSPPIFSTILRKVNGIKVLECHSFVCKSDMAAFALVHAATYAYQHQNHELRSPELNGNMYSSLDSVSRSDVFYQKADSSISSPLGKFESEYETKTLYKSDKKTPMPALLEGPILPMLPGFMYKGPNKPLIVVPPPPPDSFIPLTRDEIPSSRSSSQERAIDSSRSYLTVGNHVNNHVSRRELEDTTRRRARSADVRQLPHRVYRFVSPPTPSDDLDGQTSPLDQRDEFFFRDPSKPQMPISKAFKNFDRQFGNEFAFSKSLHVEDKGKLGYRSLGASAYALNETGTSELKEEEMAALASDLYQLPERVTRPTTTPVVTGLESTLGYMP